MKLRIFVLAVVLFVVFLSWMPGPASSRERYCYDALVDCSHKCEEVFTASDALTGACQTGCAIGYLFC